MRVVGGRDEDSPATIYLIWLSWLHSKRSKFSETSLKQRKGSTAEYGLTYLFASSEMSKLCDKVLRTNNKHDRIRTINE